MPRQVLLIPELLIMAALLAAVVGVSCVGTLVVDAIGGAQ